ncbi:transcription factor, Myb superfamily [Lentinula detonsa]|uniref:Transcription factor, Myb superfamily n=2 Tax=Lentinula TaxID=5352 RepID=A0AA38UPG6_9AGAR|nr:transcription factor, Myb superfamily [Lentinula detonsa]
MLARQRRPWTSEEDKQLIEAVKREDLKSYKPLNWCTVSNYVPNRSNKDCRKRWMSTHASAEIKITKGAWSEAEDEHLRAAVQAFGPRWCRVAQMVHGRNSDQCAKRWKDTLDPAIDRSKWTSTEDELLLKVVGEMGRKWARVVKDYFPGRTGLAAKNR